MQTSLASATGVSPWVSTNWLQVFKRAHSALLGSGGGPEQRTSLVLSEKCAVGWGSDDDETRMITASFVRAIERFAGDVCLHFLPLFQKVVAIKKTCNQLRLMTSVVMCAKRSRTVSHHWTSRSTRQSLVTLAVMPYTNNACDVGSKMPTGVTVASG